LDRLENILNVEPLSERDVDTFQKKCLSRIAELDRLPADMESFKIKQSTMPIDILRLIESYRCVTDILMEARRIVGLEPEYQGLKDMIDEVLPNESA